MLRNQGAMTGDDWKMARPRLTGYGLWLIATRLGGPLVAACAVADLLRAWLG